MSKKTTYIHAENNNKILSSNEVRLYVPPEPEKMKIIIWGKELCNVAEWNDFLKCVEEKTKENNQLKQQLEEKDEEIEKIKTKQKPIVMHSKENYYFLEEENIKLQFAQTQLAIQELEKVKDRIKHFCNIHSDEYYGVKSQVKGIEQDVCEEIDNQIKVLKGE